MEIFLPPTGQKTPAGGIKAEIYYFNDENLPVLKDKATIAIIREINEYGSVIKETYGKIGVVK